MWVTSRTGSVGCDLRKVRELSFAWKEDSWLSELTEARPVACGRCRTWFASDGKVSIERWYLSPYVEKPFNSKVIKSFIPELRSRKCTIILCSMKQISFVLWFLYLLVSWPNIEGLFKAHQLQLVSPSLTSSEDLLVLWQGLGTYLSFRFLIFLLCGPPILQSPLFGRFCNFFVNYHYRSGRLTKSRWTVCMSKSQRILCISFFRTDTGMCIYYLFPCSNFSFLHSSLWLTFPNLLCLVLYSFCTSLLH